MRQNVKVEDTLRQREERRERVALKRKRSR